MSGIETLLGTDFHGGMTCESRPHSVPYSVTNGTLLFALFSLYLFKASLKACATWEAVLHSFPWAQVGSYGIHQGDAVYIPKELRNVPDWESAQGHGHRPSLLAA